ncbi:MAG TPA: tetratricopeptide repeat protein [Anaerolineales bacterium]|nr:tetratricopeptide repeat protein [Anaerolineales bacterium]
MKVPAHTTAYLRAILVGLAIALLGLAPQPHAARQALREAQQAVQGVDPRAAATALEQAAPYYPWRQDLWVSAARHALQAGDAPGAMRLFERAGMADQLSESELLVFGDLSLTSGDSLAAEAFWQQAARSAPSSPAGPLRLAKYHLQRQDYPAAISDLQAALALSPADTEIAYQLGLLLAAWQPQEAVPYLEQASTNPERAFAALQILSSIEVGTQPDDPAYTLLSTGRALASLDEWQMAAVAFHQAVALRPDYAEAWAYLGEARQHIPLPGTPGASNGLDELEQALEIDPQSVAANLFAGLYWQRQGNSQQAIQYLQTAQELDPQNPILLVEIGQSYAQGGDLPTAQSYFEQAIALNPYDPTYWRLLAGFSMQYQVQVRELGLPAARRAVILNPTAPQALDTLAQALLYLGDWLNAERFLRRALIIDSHYAPAHLHMGMVFYYQGDASRAQLEFDLAESLSPGSWTAEQAGRLLAYYFP